MFHLAGQCDANSNGLRFFGGSALAGSGKRAGFVKKWMLVIPRRPRIICSERVGLYPRSSAAGAAVGMYQSARSLLLTVLRRGFPHFGIAFFGRRENTLNQRWMQCFYRFPVTGSRLSLHSSLFILRDDPLKPEKAALARAVFFVLSPLTETQK